MPTSHDTKTPPILGEQLQFALAPKCNWLHFGAGYNLGVNTPLKYWPVIGLITGKHRIMSPRPSAIVADILRN